jgi:hypothetical protein
MGCAQLFAASLQQPLNPASSKQFQVRAEGSFFGQHARRQAS